MQNQFWKFNFQKFVSTETKVQTLMLLSGYFPRFIKIDSQSLLSMMKKDEVTTDSSNETPFSEFWSLEWTVFRFIGKSLHGVFSGGYYKQNSIENSMFVFGISLLSSLICFSIYTLFVVECDIKFVAEFVPIILTMITVSVKVCYNNVQ